MGKVCVCVYGFPAADYCSYFVFLCFVSLFIFVCYASYRSNLSLTPSRIPPFLPSFLPFLSIFLSSLPAFLFPSSFLLVLPPSSILFIHFFFLLPLPLPHSFIPHIYSILSLLSLFFSLRTFRNNSNTNIDNYFLNDSCL